MYSRTRWLTQKGGGNANTKQHQQEGRSSAADPAGLVTDEVDVWNGFPADGLSALSAAASALYGSECPVRQLTWFPDYGCALLGIGSDPDLLTSAPDGGVIMSRPGEVVLHLVALDGWSFHVHCALAGVSATTKMLHGAHSRGGFTDVALSSGDINYETCWPLVKAVLQFILEKQYGAVAARGRSPCIQKLPPPPPPSSAPSHLLRQALARLDLWLLRRQLLLINPDTATPLMVTAAMRMLDAATTKAAALAADGYDMAAFEAACRHAHQQLRTAVGERAWRAARASELPGPESADFLGNFQPPSGVLPAAFTPRAEEQGLAAARQRAERNLGSLPLLPEHASFSQILKSMSDPGPWRDLSSDVAAQLVLRSVEGVLFRRALQQLGGGSGGDDTGHARLDLGEGEVAALENVVDEYRAALQRFLSRQGPGSGAVMVAELRSREVLVVWVAYCLIHAAACRAHPLMASRGGTFASHEALRHLVLSDRLAVDAALSVAAYLQGCRQRAVAAGGSRQADLFSLRDGGVGTMAFAEDYVAACPVLQGILTADQADAAERVTAHWKEVQRKQQLAAQLRITLAKQEMEQAQLNRELQQHKAKLAALEAELKAYHFWQGAEQHATRDKVVSVQSEVLGAESKLLAINAEICRTRCQLSEAEKAPPPVVQPLPSDANLARQWLFFLHMPPLLRHLSRASFLAQQMLLPRPISADTSTAIAVRYPTSLVQHYNTQRQCRTYASYLRQPRDGADGRVMLWSEMKALTSVGPNMVDDCRTPSDGVWYPDSLAPLMAWAGSGAVADQGQGFPSPFFNPFAVLDEGLLELYFTEKLPQGAESLQWAMHVRSSASVTSPSRGNNAIAQQDTKPSWLSKPAFLELCTLRAFPLRQLRRLAATLHDHVLPLAQPAVHTLVRQLLFHLGTLTDDEPPQLLWRRGWEAECDVLTALYGDLTALAEDLEQTPREHGAVLLLGEVAGYLAAWYPPCRDVARRFAAMTARAADELEPQVAVAGNGGGSATDGSAISNLLAKQCRWRCMALMCFSGAAAADAAASAAATVTAAPPLLTEADAQEMIRLMVLINHGRVFLHSPKLREELAPLFVRAHNVIASAIGPLMEAVVRRPDILTDAVAAVLQQRTPRELTWRRLAATGSFEAVSVETSATAGCGSSDRLFSINLLDGTVLFDGWPPGKLPKEVTEHPLYRRTFGEWNFDVALASDGVMRALRPVQQRLYDFAVSADGQRLAISETDFELGSRLELLDAGPKGACGGWGAELPLSLRTLHSHWLSREQGVMVLRPLDFQKHDVHFIVRCTPAPVPASTPLAPAAPDVAVAAATSPSHACIYDCRRVPPHLRHRHWHSLLAKHRAELTDKLVLLAGAMVKDRILARFEDLKFIHAYLVDSSDGGDTPRGLGGSTGPLRPGAPEVLPPKPPISPPRLLLLELPRYGLEFEVRPAEGQVLPRDYAGYRLRQRQLLVQAAEKPRTPYDAVLYTLLEFQQYLVLERVPNVTGAVVGARREDELVLVPADGMVVQAGGGSGTGGLAAGGCVRIDVSQRADVHLKAHCYEIHGRFKDLRAASIPARLQLAALYAATGTLLPEPLSRCTGGQMAMVLLRQCWGNRPLGNADLAQLRSAARLGGYLTPGLRLLAHELEVSAGELQHLREAAGSGAVSAAPPQPLPAAILDPDAAISYCQALQPPTQRGGSCGDSSLCGGPNPRLLLTPGEEDRTLGMRPSTVAVLEEPMWLRLGQYKAVEIREPFPAAAGFVAKVETALVQLVEVPTFQENQRQARIPPYPLEVEGAYGGVDEGLRKRGKSSAGVARGPSGPAVATDASAASASWTRALTPLEVEMHEELRDSWEAHHGAPALEEHQLMEGAAQEIARWMAEVAQRREASEAFLLRHLTTIPEDVGRHGTSFRLMQAAGSAPTPSTLDLLRAAWQGGPLLRQFNPFLSPQAVQVLEDGVLLWAQLCVLQDRLRRLGRLAAEGPAYRIALVQELLVRRTWDVVRHPQWLVFEVEGQLQIRPAQAAVAQQVMANPGAIAQLNMGEGKTRVILPLLVLHWADGCRVVRLNFLSTLLEEAYCHLHLHLCAGVLGRKLFTLHFNRDVSVTEAGARAMTASLLYCKREGGLLLVAPEHRLSLLLKRQEMWQQQQSRPDGQDVVATAVAALDQLASLPYLDILDESDELLHHRLQLVYACGAQIDLPHIQERAIAMQALLAVGSRLAVAENSGDQPMASHSQQPQPLLLLPGSAVLEPPLHRCPGSFSGLRLLPGDALTASLPGWHRRLAEALMVEPPYELRWLQHHPLRVRILNSLTEEGQSCEALLGPDAEGPSREQLTGSQVAVVLALRGLLAGGLMQHCLQKRHRVEYGVNRYEFAQPDVALLLTNLSYYYDGLSRHELREALVTLLGMGLNVQRDFYEGWLRLGRGEIPAEDLAKFDCVAKVDVTNEPQLDLMYGYLRYNTGLIDFWLNHCVFPSESLHQARPENPSLRATNGKMLDVILSNTLGYTTLHTGTTPQQGQGQVAALRLQQRENQPVNMDGTAAAAGGAGGGGGHCDAAGAGAAQGCCPDERPQWQVLLDTALDEGVDALLDCGALLAGASNRDAADYLLARLDGHRYQGVTYFDEALRSWTVCDLRGRRLPRHASAIMERQTLVIYDDARCRGADLQLRPGAVGLLTLGPSVCKDKLMQAAGRLRQLGRGQRLHFAAAPDVTAKIRRLSGLPAAEPGTSSTGADTGNSTVSDSRLRGGQQQPTTALQVLRWVMANTVTATLHGVMQWSTHGLHFAATKDAPERALHDEVLELGPLYGGSKAPQPVGEVVASKVRQRLHHCRDGSGGGDGSGGLSAHAAGLMMRIRDQAALYGRGHMVAAGGGAAAAGDEECERELEEEREREKEREVEVPRVSPAAECDWNYGTAFAAASPAQLDSDARLVALRDAVSGLLWPSSLASLSWSAEVLCTANFLCTTTARTRAAITTSRCGKEEALNEYLRPVDAVLLFPSGQMVLVSEREADQLQGLVWASWHVSVVTSGSGGVGGGGSIAVPLLASLCYMRDAFARGTGQGPLPLLAVPLRAGGGSGMAMTAVVPARVPPVAATAIRPLQVHWQQHHQQQLCNGWLSAVGPSALVSVQLFNGNASGYGSGAQQRELRSLVRRRQVEVEALWCECTRSKRPRIQRTRSCRQHSARYGTRILTETITDIDLLVHDTKPPGLYRGTAGLTIGDTDLGAPKPLSHMEEIERPRRPFKLWTPERCITADTVIIATGASAKRLRFPGSGDESEGGFWNRGISACAICDGTSPLIRYGRVCVGVCGTGHVVLNNKPVAVVGGGDSAMEEAMFLTRYASKVYIVHRFDYLEASKSMARRALSNPKIEILWCSQVVEAHGNDQGNLGSITVARSPIPSPGHTPAALGLAGSAPPQPTAVSLERLAVGGLFFAIGHRPATDFLKGQLDLDEYGYIVTVPGSTATSVPGALHAAPDVIGAGTEVGHGTTAGTEYGSVVGEMAAAAARGRDVVLPFRQ
ncbi:hypothetical protein VOLCADRAFT_104794 [Volvox carteri f. nagariensis]|uniref:ubiquitinyl hydrolase 1 n=1 Tax=Volvox carteri f. nagariensis TaxID=3068 RepID=D8TW37_VOLCA|nr:uncharacterized protein VOLCADRAFT_104794 [Volvox carteri f. nagariensis]EFJ48301.1 hypothetical protein VOLCADRAFT_104794 [Volvox carteri f. nagariensis]|eukprot:XP_002950555.1 hypothetical protein VOLCADRAFT_104794 [Volvox carteri f. nagariensis]